MPRPGSLDHPSGFDLALFTRMLYSCLVDADYLDTEAFLDSGKAAWRGGRPTLEELGPRLDAYLTALRAKESQAPLNARRNEILEACLDAAGQEPGMFSLTVPTGGGKTISSLAFALRHALHHGLSRIIYVIPYTSIIEQNAQVFRQILGEQALVEHHSNLPEPDGDMEDENAAWRRNRLAAENWDAPLVVTTNVQFFESLFANRSSRCRKLHNLARSVVILDEAQMLPREVLLPCLEALRALVKGYGASVVLCTATQPALSDADTFRDAAVHPREIAPEPRRLYHEFRRVRLAQHGKLAQSELVGHLAGEKQVLCIVNTRGQAREVFRQLCETVGHEGVFHLSALMYPGHRSQKLKEIRECLAAGDVCRVVSTQLVEAGVDLDFPVVWRALAGLDSLAQAAGRCNREGRLEGLGILNVFEPAQGLPPGSQRVPAQEAASVLRQADDPLGLEAVEAYFGNLFWQQRDKLDAEDIVGRLMAGRADLNFPFAEVAEDFSYFDSPGQAVLVCPDEAKREEIIGGLRYADHPGRYLRMAQPYTVQLYPQELNKLRSTGEVEDIAEGLLPVLNNLTLYDPDLGLVVELSGEIPPGHLYVC